MAPIITWYSSIGGSSGQFHNGHNAPNDFGGGTDTGDPLLFHSFAGAAGADQSNRFVNTGDASIVENVYIRHNHWNPIYECGLYIQPFGTLDVTPYSTWGKAKNPAGALNDAASPYFRDYSNAHVNTHRNYGYGQVGTVTGADLTGSNVIANREEGSKRDYNEIVRWADHQTAEYPNNTRQLQGGAGVIAGVIRNSEFGLFINLDPTNHRASSDANSPSAIGYGFWAQFGPPATMTAGNWSGYNITTVNGTTEGTCFPLWYSTDNGYQPDNFNTNAADTSTMGLSQISPHGAGTSHPSNNGYYHFQLAMKIPVDEPNTGYRETSLILRFTYF